MPAEEAKDEQSSRFRLEKVYEERARPPLGSTWAGVCRVGHDIMLEVGYADVASFALEFAEGRKPPPDYKVKMRIVGTYILSTTALANLYETSRKAYLGLKEMGVPGLPGLEGEHAE